MALSCNSAECLYKHAAEDTLRYLQFDLNFALWLIAPLLRSGKVSAVHKAQCQSAVSPQSDVSGNEVSNGIPRDIIRQ